MLLKNGSLTIHDQRVALAGSNDVGFRRGSIHAPQPVKGTMQHPTTISTNCS